MNYKTHINGGILVGLYTASQMHNIKIVPEAIFLGSSIWGSLLPDIDHSGSYIGKKTKSVSKVINKVAGHRKLFHAPVLYLFCYSICMGYFMNPMWLIAVKGMFLGILSHIILDSLTIGGIPWFYPISKKKFSLSKIKTNGQLESTFCGVLICVNTAMLLDILHITSIFTFTR